MPKLTVITVVYNNVRDIERTILSVLDQSYKNIEYIVIDGASTDGTLDVVMRYNDRIAKIVSEPDKGIYHAMNKGLALAEGRYVLFMNSGDEIYANHTVEDIFNTSPGADIYYGETEMYNDNWESLGKRRHEVPEEFSWKSFKFGMSVSHQAIYIRRSIVSPFNLRYKYSADIDWIIKASKKASNIVNVHAYVAKYLVGGMSKQKQRESLIERFKIFSKYYGLLPNVLNHLIIAGNLLAYFIKHRKTND
ncbi:glycosyltransferase [Pedobacter changchengzhani]|uniref:Glycosyltransferase n=1 Tax=Pedobacter changchengzhani TaxID=2529274 RepID=A0A4R5MNQ1_9SPHI|nr:glycosyltransferase family 2 protein [Pedobacter changchengzhani]TDG37216.1 glycosyltransferase [Pedobacter changchengzhani]